MLKNTISNKNNVKQRGGASINASITGPLQIIDDKGNNLTQPFIQELLKLNSQGSGNVGVNIAPSFGANMGIGMGQPRATTAMTAAPVQANPMAPPPAQNQVAVAPGGNVAQAQANVNQALPNVAQPAQYNLVNQPKPVTQMAQKVSPSDIDLSQVNVVDAAPPVPNISDFVKSRQVILETVEVYKTTAETENDILNSYRENNFKPKLDSISVADINTLYQAIVATKRWYPPPPLAGVAPNFIDFKRDVKQYTDRINGINTLLAAVPLAEYTDKFDNLNKLYNSINTYKTNLTRIKIQPTYTAQREQLINRVDLFIQKLLKYMLAQYLEPILDIRQKIYVDQYDTNPVPGPPRSKYDTLRTNVIAFLYPAAGGVAPAARAQATALAQPRGEGGVPSAPLGGPPPPPHLRIYDTINFAAIKLAFDNIQRQSDAQKTALEGIYSNRQNRATIYGETRIQKDAKRDLADLQTIMGDLDNVKALITSSEDQYLKFIKYLYDNLEKLKNIYQNFEDTVANQAAARIDIVGIGKGLNDKINDVNSTYNELRQNIEPYINSGKSNEQFKEKYMEKIVNLNNKINTVKYELLRDFITKAKNFADHAANTGPNNGRANREAVFGMLKNALQLYDVEIAEIVVNYYDGARGRGVAVVSTQAEKEQLRDDIVALLTNADPVIPQTWIGAMLGRPPQGRQPPTPEERRRRLAIAKIMTTDDPSAISLMEYLNDIGGPYPYNLNPLLSPRDGKKTIIELQGEIAIFNEFAAMDATLNNYYKHLDKQNVFVSNETEYSTATSDASTPQGPVNLQPFNRRAPPPAARRGRLSDRGTMFRTLGDMRRRTIGYGGRHTKKKHKRSRNRHMRRQAKRQTRRQAKRRYSRKK